jgi:hypothetical protein
METMQTQFVQALDIITERVDLKIGRIADMLIQQGPGSTPVAEGVAPSAEVAQPASGGRCEAKDAPTPASTPAPAVSPSAEGQASARGDLPKEVLDTLRQELLGELREELRGELALLRGELWSELSGALRGLNQELTELRQRQDHLGDAFEVVQQSSCAGEVVRAEIAALQKQQDHLRRETDLRLGHLLADMEALRRCQLLGDAGARPAVAPAAPFRDSDTLSEVVSPSSRSHRKKSIAAADKVLTVAHAGKEQFLPKARTGDGSSSDESGSLSSEFYASTASTSVPGRDWLKKFAGSLDSDFMLEACVGRRDPSVEEKGASADTNKGAKETALGKGRLSLVPPSLGAASPRDIDLGSGGGNWSSSAAAAQGPDIQALRQQWHEQLSVLDKHINEIETMKGQKLARLPH